MNELIKINENVIAAIDNKSLSDTIKPLKKEIPLFDCYVNDINELCSDLVFVTIKPNDSLQLKLDKMKYRETTVGIYFNEQRIGELYEGFEEDMLFNLLSAGKELKAIVKEKHISMNRKVMQLSIKLLDF